MKQTREVGVAGGFINQMMGNNSTVPVIGEGATVLMYSDRLAFEVIKVSKDSSKCTIQRYSKIREDFHVLSDQQGYTYDKLTKETRNLVWRNKKGGTWCEHSTQVRVIPKIQKYLNQNSSKYFLGDQIKEVYGQEIYNEIYRTHEEDGTYRLGMAIMEGITKEYNNYDPISIIFGIKDEYYDFSF
tara:strand:+ start:2065 stop:2619 length:555 start_codon:yes stop_codon:yes gene_type:complete